MDTPQPWLRPYLPRLQQVLDAAHLQSTAAALNSAIAGDALAARFVEQSALPDDEPYESFIFRTACVPTRDNTHDLLNGLIWLSYPRTKRRLNALQAGEIARLGTTGARGALRDALTVFDENAALLQAPAELVDALRAHDWHTVFVTQRKLWDQAHLILFGHALLEKLLQPRKAITAHVWLTDELTDDSVAASLSPERLTTKPFLPLPVLGVPGWWHLNEDPAFYADALVFRPRA